MRRNRYSAVPLTLTACLLAACSAQPPQTTNSTQASPASQSSPTSQSSPNATGWVAKTLPELSNALAAGDLTSAELTQMYLDRIDAVDRSGPTLQAVLTLNPDAAAQADASDARRREGQALGPLDGLPILFKDNIETLDPMPTTAGAVVLKDNLTGRDSPLVAGLRAQGAVILGKTNLSQWANFRSNESVSGWSALGGQVRNPHMLDRSPCGSSSGSGAAAAASLAAGTVGTETNGSVICPSNVNGIVGFKPTVGLIPQTGIIPISASQDTAGPMTKSVRGAAMMLDAMDGASVDYAAQLDAGALKGQRIGIMRFSVGGNADINALFDRALDDLRSAGAEVVEIETFDLATEGFGGKALSVLQTEFKDGLNLYLADAAPEVKARTLSDVIAFNAKDTAEQSLFDQDLFESSDAMAGIEASDYLAARADIQRATRKDGIDKMLAEHNVVALVAPSGPVSSRVDPINGDVWPSWAGAGYLAAVAGYPNLTVPMGDVHGVPVGISFTGGADTDAQILGLGYAYEQASKRRVAPQYLRTAEDRPEIAGAMQR